jgi:hypothetical protein
MTTSIPADVLRDLAPNGIVRAGINIGNPALAQRDGAGTEIRGIAVDLARELGCKLDVDVELVTYDAAGKLFDAVRANAPQACRARRRPCAAEAFHLVLEDRLDAAAGVRQALTQFAHRHDGSRVIDDRFVVIEQAVAMPKARIAGAQPLAGVHRHVREELHSVL